MNDFPIIQQTTKNLKNNITEKYNIGFCYAQTSHDRQRGYSPHQKWFQHSPAPPPPKKTPSAPPFTNQNFQGSPFCNFFYIFPGPSLLEGVPAMQVL